MWIFIVLAIAVLLWAVERIWQLRADWYDDRELKKRQDRGQRPPITFCLLTLMVLAGPAIARDASYSVPAGPKPLTAVGSQYRPTGVPVETDRKVLDIGTALADPETHVSFAREIHTDLVGIDVKADGYKSTNGTLDQLDHKLRTLTYDPTPKSGSDSKSIEQVIQTGTGNCYEIAKLAEHILRVNGFRAVSIGMVMRTGPHHVICVFNEPDGAFSYVSASRFGIGVYRVREASLKDLVSKHFKGVADVYSD